MSITDVAKNLEIAKSFGYSGETGVLIQETFPHTPSEGKLMRGDIVTALNGKTIKNVTQLRNMIAAIPPNTEVTLEVFRNGKTTNAVIKLGEQPKDVMALGRSSPERSPQAPSEEHPKAMGLTLSDLNDDLVQKYGLPSDVKDGAARSTQISPKSPALRSGIEPGNVIPRGQPTKPFTTHRMRRMHRARSIWPKAYDCTWPDTKDRGLCFCRSMGRSEAPSRVARSLQSSLRIKALSVTAHLANGWAVRPDGVRANGRRDNEGLCVVDDENGRKAFSMGIQRSLLRLRQRFKTFTLLAVSWRTGPVNQCRRVSMNWIS